MQYQEILSNLNEFVKKIQDDESKKIFDIRLQYLIKRDKEKFYEGLDQVLHNNREDYSCWRLNEYEKRNIQKKGKNVIIFGAGDYGRLTCRSLKYIGRKIDCFVDNNVRLWGTEYKEIPIYKLEDAQKKFKDCIVVVAVSGLYQAEIYRQLIHNGFHESDILIPQEGYLYCDIANQYFDSNIICTKAEEEYFVDAGCYDGMTSIKYGEICGVNLRKIYAFEPDKKNYLECDKVFSKSKYEYELYECAAWDKEAELRFCSLENESYGSHVRTDGDYYIKADSIDNKLKGRKATYIKYDVEGSELEALRGSKKTIQKYCPKLAISVYHKPEDIVEIPVFLESLHMHYRYYLRHYQTRMEETTLYAI